MCFFFVCLFVCLFFVFVFVFVFVCFVFSKIPNSPLQMKNVNYMEKSIVERNSVQFGTDSLAGSRTNIGHL